MIYELSNNREVVITANGIDLTFCDYLDNSDLVELLEFAEEMEKK